MNGKRRDLIAGGLFFLLMAAVGALILFVSRGKWGPELKRERARFDTQQADAYATAGLRKLQLARDASGAERLRHAREAVVYLGKVIAVRQDRADLYAARAEAHAYAGWHDEATADIARAKEIDPGADWSGLEKRVSEARP